ncbi:hypothetical protein HQ544_04060 [Candidatus Falkowbacteria bacterium]|nr:hypothetical protein [Candidatus Falkowbacteria bacterium]
MEGEIKKEEIKEEIEEDEVLLKDDKGKQKGKKKPYREIIVAIVAILALVVSIKSCKVSERALDRADDSNEISKRMLEVSQRPYLDLTFKKFEENDSYFLIDERNQVIKMKAELINIGNTPAKKICVGNVYYNKGNPDDPENDRVMTVKRHGEITDLLPNKSIVINDIELPPCCGKSFQDFAEEVKEPGKLEFVVFYNSDLNSLSRPYNTVISPDLDDGEFFYKLTIDKGIEIEENSVCGVLDK